MRLRVLVRGGKWILGTVVTEEGISIMPGVIVRCVSKSSLDPNVNRKRLMDQWRA